MVKDKTNCVCVCVVKLFRLIKNVKKKKEFHGKVQKYSCLHLFSKRVLSFCICDIIHSFSLSEFVFLLTICIYRDSHLIAK